MVRSRFMAQMEQLNTELIVMGTLCENALEKVANALDNPTDEVSRDIIILSKKTEEKERELENICINLLLKQQPVASDLRQISSALKMVTDMRRIGEVAGNIAEILNQDNLRMDYDTSILKKMAAATKKMVSNTLDAFVKSDIRTAQQVERDDDQVDELFAQSKHELIQIIRNSQDSGENISQWVLFMITGTLEEDSIHDILRGGRS